MDFDQGKSPSEIYSILNKTVSRATVYRWCNKFKHNILSTKPHHGRPRKIRTKEFLKKLKKKILLNKKRKSARSIAKDEGCSHRTILLAIKDDLSLNPFTKS